MKRYFYRFGILVVILVLVVGIVIYNSDSEGALNKTTWDERVQNFMSSHDTTLTAKDVQYDIANNLDKRFYIEGSGKLSTYYNYGYENMESTHFVIKLSVSGADDWYIYCDRKVFAKTLEEVKENDRVYYTTICYIPESHYRQGQGNMAILYAIK